MAEESSTKEGGSRAAAEEPRTYHRDRLVAEAEGIFGEPSHVVVAALSSGRISQKVNLTVDEVKRAIREYNEHEVEIDHPVPDEEA